METRPHLAAILAAAAVPGATEALSAAARHALGESVASNGGRVVDLAAHPVLAVFDSVAGAVRAALEVQRATREAGGRWRIGLHLGDLSELPGGGVAGHGVDVALQLPARAQAGGIVASPSIPPVAHEEGEADFEDLGPQALDGLAEPLHLYRVIPRPLAAGPAAPDVARPRAWLARWSGLTRRARGIIAVLAAGGAVLSGGLGYWNTYRAVHGSDPAATASAADAGPLSIAVLPFSNLTGDPAQEDLADGLTASITADLSRIGDAFVVGAGSALAYKGKTLKARQVGQELGVRYVLQGHVQRGGGRIRINAQLIDTASNAQLWSETFDGDAGDLFALQDQVTTLIGNSMGRELVVRAARESERRHSNPTVTDLLLQARAVQLRPQSLANWQQVEALSRQALALDPANHDAALLLAKSLALQGLNFFREMGLGSWAGKIGEAAELSVRLRDANAAADDPQLEEVLGLVAQLRGDFDGALRAYQLRLALQPKSQTAYVELANAYYLRAEPKPALALLQQALALDPRRPPDSLLINLSFVAFMLGDNDAAIEWGLKAQAANPSWYARYTTLAMAYASKGEPAKARAAAAAAFQASPVNTVSGVAHNLDFPLIPVHPAYRAWALGHVIPAMRLAGFPE